MRDEKSATGSASPHSTGRGQGIRQSKHRRWLRQHLPADRPEGVLERDWQYAQRFVAGHQLKDIGQSEGVSKQMVHFRVKRLAARLGDAVSEPDG